MSNFLRAIRLSLKHRWLLVGGFVCSLMVAILWGGNISGVYPFVEVIMRGKSLRYWVDEEIKTTAEKANQVAAELADKREDLKEAEGDRAAQLRKEISFHQTRLAAEEKAHETAVWLRPIIYDYLPPGPFQTLIFIVVALLLATVVKGLFLMGNVILIERVSQLTVYDIRKQFFQRTLDLDLASFGEEPTAALMSRFTHDTQAIHGGLNSLFGAAVREPLKMFVCLGGAALISWRLLLFSIVVTPLGLILINSLARSIKRANRRAMEEMSLLYRRLSETFGGMQAVKAFNMERYERSRFNRSAAEYVRKAMRIAFYNSLTKPVTEVMGIAVISVALLAGAYLVLRHETHLLGIRMCSRPPSLSSMLWFYALLIGAADPLRKLTAIYHVIQKGAAAADRVFPLMDRRTKVVEPARPVRLPATAGDITFDGVDFSYLPGQPVLSGVSLHIRAGETVAVVGPNGCGKTTLINLLPRFFDPTGGSVRLGGVDVKDVALADLRSKIGLVSQHALLFDDTVLANLRYGSPGASDEQLIEAARKAHAHRFIEEQLDDGYRTVVGRGGERLSGGQRQRLALARAILRDPEILILDEATSQVDLESEQLIHRVLEEFVRHRTAVMITHRLSTLALADRVIVMEAGRILDMGRHEELLGRCDLYRRLHEIRFRQSA